MRRSMAIVLSLAVAAPAIATSYEPVTVITTESIKKDRKRERERQSFCRKVRKSGETSPNSCQKTKTIPTDSLVTPICLRPVKMVAPRISTLRLRWSKWHSKESPRWTHLILRLLG